MRQTGANGLAIWLVAIVAVGACYCAKTPPEPAPTVPVTGTVTTVQGAPLAGAVLTLTADPDDGRVPFATTKTTIAGAFRMGRVPPGGYQIHARAPGYVDGMARISVALPTGKRIDLKLTATVAMAGRIQDERGAAVPLARVLVFAVADATSAPIHETHADEKGAFHLGGLAPGAHRLLIEAPGIGTASAGPVQVPDADVLVVLPGDIRAIVGRVTRAGQTITGARVLLGGEAVAEARSVDADAEGRFAFAGLGPGTYALRAEAGGFVTPVMRQVVPMRAPAHAPHIELALESGSFARGKVVGDDGQPVADALVQIDLVPATGLWLPVVTRADGAWTSAPLGPGTYQVRARHPGMVARRTASVLVAPLGSAEPAILPPTILELVRTGQITGRVVDDHDAPLPGATIHDRLAETEELGVIWARLPLAAEAAAQRAGSVLRSSLPKTGSRRTTSDMLGRFVLGDVPPGRVQVEVLNAASVPLRAQAVMLAPGAHLDLGTLRVLAAIHLVGRVLDSDGLPVPGARVAASAVGATADSGGGLYAVSGADGGFSLPLSAGEHRLTASARSYDDASATVRLTGAGNTSVPVTLRLAKRADANGKAAP